MSMARRTDVVTLLALIAAKPRTKTALSTLSGLTRCTVRSWIKELHAQGLLEPVQVQPTPGARPQVGWRWIGGAR